MKKITWSIVFSAMTFLLQAQESIVGIANLNDVTVYNQGAELNHISKIKLPAGTNEVVVNNIANHLDENSIRIGANQNVTVMSVRFARNYLTDNHSPEYLQLEAQLKEVREKLVEIQNERDAEKEVLEILKENRGIGGDNNGVLQSELSKIIDYVKNKQHLTRNSISRLDRLADEQGKEVTKLQNQLNELQRNKQHNQGQLIAQVISPQATTADFNISYVSPQAGWSAFYDLRADKLSEPLRIIYKANVYQNTGIDWKRIKLTLSTGNPSQSSTAPILSTWHLRFAPTEIPQLASGYSAAPAMNKVRTMSNMELSDNLLIKEEETQQMNMAYDAGNYVSHSENQLTASFDIDLPYDILSNNKAHSVALKEYKQAVNYKYYAAPRADDDAFLMAEIANYEKLHLMPGMANIVFENTYTGKTHIDPNSTLDTLNLSMGRDKKISVKRERVAEMSGTRFIGNNKRQEFSYEIKVRNSKQENIQIMLKDQYPISTDKDIEIELLESGNAEVNKETGILTWNLRIPAGQTQTIRFKYSVKHPKNKPLANL